MKLQLALDFDALERATEFLSIVGEYVDIIEIGTPLLASEGMHAVQKIKQMYPKKEILCDAKIMDGGETISEMAFQAGADIVTVLGITNNATIQGAVQTAGKYGKMVCADTLGIRASELPRRTKELESMGVQMVAVHTAHDLQDCIAAPIEALKVIQQNLHSEKCQSVISGGVKIEDMDQIRVLQPDVVIVGGGLIDADDPVATAKAFAKAMKE